MTGSTQPLAQPSLFTDLEAPTKPPGRRNPPRKAASRQRELQVHLPIVQGEAAELLRMEDLVVSQRPLTRSDCEGEARPCPWARCPKHLYYERFLEFEAVIQRIHLVTVVSTILSGCEPSVEEAVKAALVSLFEPDEDDQDPDGRARRPKTIEAVGEAVRKGRAMFTTDKGGRLHSDVLSSTDVRGPWPTCSLDVAKDIHDAGATLEAEDTARLINKTRECVRLIEINRRRDFARARALRPWLEEIASKAELDEHATEDGDDVDWYGGG